MIKTPRIYTSDPSHKEIRLRLYAHGVDNFDSAGPAIISPAKIDIPEERRTQAHRLSITNNSDITLMPKIVSDHPGVIDIDMPDKPIKPGENIIVLVSAAEDLSSRRIKTSFTLEMNDADNSRYTIPVVIGSLPDRNRHAGAETHKPAPSSAIKPTGGG